MTHTTDLAAEALAAHEKLMQHLQELEARAGHETGLAELAAGLSRVRSDVTAHFEFEQQGGYMSDVLDRAPHMCPRIDKLLAQHAELLESLDELITRARGGTEQTIASLRQRTAQWIAAVRAHESAENRLVQKVFSREECAED
jgi:hemerythrin